jgi:hypothetical protein
VDREEGQVNRNFRDYATRVSFNLTISRNQIACLRVVLFDLAFEEESFDARNNIKEEHGAVVSHHVTGMNGLEKMGLIVRDPTCEAEDKASEKSLQDGVRFYRKYWGPAWRLTPEGEHVVSLLEAAGLIVRPAAANSNQKQQRRRIKDA